MLKDQAAVLLTKLDLGSGVAETDTRLESARVETSVFDDLLADRVDLVPGTKGSGKTALYRIFVDFLPGLLLKDRRVVIAHGIQHHQDTVFLAYQEQFDSLNENDFIDFWCVYLISLAYEQFIRSPQYNDLLSCCKEEIDDFRQQYANARVPELGRAKTLRETIGWALAVVKSWKPKIKWTLPEGAGQLEFSLEGVSGPKGKIEASNFSFMQNHINALTTSLEKILSKSNLSVWLMVDRLDEIFARRSSTEQRVLRGLLNTLRFFKSERIRIKIFLRDDILEHIVADAGFTALSHVSARSSDTLRWSEEQILAMIVRRIFASTVWRTTYSVDPDLLRSSVGYQKQLFYKVFDDTVYRPPNQSPTLRWIYNHTKDGRGVVTPRDVIFLLTRACQWQRDAFRRDPQGNTDRMILGPAVTYGLEELSTQKRDVYLRAEFPHKWPTIKQLLEGGTEYSEPAMKRVFGKNHLEAVEDLLSLGILERSTRRGVSSFKVPFLYRRGLECTQRFVA